MRVYHGKEHRIHADGSIEIEGTWAGVQPIAIGLALVMSLLLVLRAGLLLVPAFGFALYLLILPTRRRVLFDATRRCLRIEHAGPWRETNATPIPFADIRAVRFERAGRKGGRGLLRAVARTTWGDAYLVTLYEGTDEGALVKRISRVLSP
jgi:hypothetical protein